MSTLWFLIPSCVQDCLQFAIEALTLITEEHRKLLNVDKLIGIMLDLMTGQTCVTDILSYYSSGLKWVLCYL